MCRIWRELCFIFGWVTTVLLLLWNVIKCFALWNLIFVYLRLIIVLIAKHTVHLVLGTGVWVFKKFLKICSVQSLIPLFLQIFSEELGLGWKWIYFLICFVWYEGFVKLCSKLCAFVNTIMIFSILCVNFVFGDWHEWKRIFSIRFNSSHPLAWVFWVFFSLKD